MNPRRSLASPLNVVLWEMAVLTPPSLLRKETLHICWLGRPDGNLLPVQKIKKEPGIADVALGGRSAQLFFN